MVVKSATKKKLMDLGIPEEVAHLLSEDRKWNRNATNSSIKELIRDGTYEEFVNIIRPVMNHYPFKHAPVENLMLWYGIIDEACGLKNPTPPESPVFYTGVGYVMYLDGGSPNEGVEKRLKQYVVGFAIPDPTFDEKKLRFKKAWGQNLNYDSINCQQIYLLITSRTS